MNILRNKPALAIGGVAGLALLGFLAFGVFGIHTAFIDDEVAEADPFATSDDAAADSDESSSTDLDTNAETTEAEEASGPDAEGNPEDDEREAGQVITLLSGDFFSREHPTSGDALVLNDGSEARFLRFENFAGDNGPDLNVYLRNPNDENDFIDLGDLKGNIGDQNYEIPTDVDLSVYNEVDIWCVRFGVSFGGAALA